MADINWRIEWMQCKPTDGTFSDVVITASWRCIGSQTVDGNTFYGTDYGLASFPQPEEDGQFTPYADLAQEQVLGWCWADGVDKAATEAAVQAQIDAQINSPVTQPPLPWAQA